MPDFWRHYGDYYVSELRVGADTQVLVSTNASFDAKREAASVIVEARFLCFSASKKITVAEGTAASSLTVGSVSAYDTLSKKHDTMARSSDLASVSGTASGYVMLGRSLEDRVSRRAREVGLADSQVVSDDMLQKICLGGLVAEVTLVPFATHAGVTRSLYI